jgi:hypothetical protein
MNGAQESATELNRRIHGLQCEHGIWFESLSSYWVVCNISWSYLVCLGKYRISTPKALDYSVSKVPGSNLRPVNRDFI